MSDPKAAPIKQLIFSPLKRFQKEHCEQCNKADGPHCNPSEQRFLACILCALLDTTKRNNELRKLRGTHL